MPRIATSVLATALLALACALPAAAQRSAAEPVRRVESESARTAAVRSQASRSLAPAPTAVPEEPGGTCAPALVNPARPKLVFLNYFWYKPEEFQCNMLVPSDGPVDSNDSGFNGYYHRRFKRLERHGVDVLGLVLTGFDRPDPDVDGNVVGTWRHGRNLQKAAFLAGDVGLPFFVYYDLAVRMSSMQKLCKTPAPASQYRCRNPQHTPVDIYDLRKASIYHQIRRDLLRIKDDLILPFVNGYYMLENEAGQRILDDGLPRPVIGIYISRELVANNRINRLLDFVVRKYREDGLGRPAFVLDNIFWDDPVHRDVVERFGDTAVALTSFFPVNQPVATERGVTRMLEWVPHLRKLYSDAGEALLADPDLHALQVWPGVASMFDNRQTRTASCVGFQDPLTPQMRWHLHGKEDWRALLNMAYESTYRVQRGCAEGSDGELPVQSLVINYENEFRESAVTDCVRKTSDGRISYPFHFACELLRVAREEDRWR
ncbi:MAG: hypothetical protein R3325_07895 [Thermoanaerobaculia bacterium]|nr:hypothetical protein [Thermoanaerobaculia bacterium]